MDNDSDILKRKVAKQAIDYIEDGDIVGVGTGTTVEYFINELSKLRNNIAGAVPSSRQTASLLQFYEIPVIELNNATTINLYIDGADAYNEHGQLIKGAGGALAQEKIVAAASDKFVCIVDITKPGSLAKGIAVPIEILPMARSFVAREITKISGRSEYRANFTTDNNNVILDVYGLDLSMPITTEQLLNNIPGVVANGIFAVNNADVVLVAE